MDITNTKQYRDRVHQAVKEIQHDSPYFQRLKSDNIILAEYKNSVELNQLVIDVCKKHDVSRTLVKRIIKFDPDFSGVFNAILNLK